MWVLLNKSDAYAWIRVTTGACCGYSQLLWCLSPWVRSHLGSGVLDLGCSFDLYSFPFLDYIRRFEK